MLSVRKRISIDSFMRIILICALIAVPMSMVFFLQLKAETFDKTLTKQPYDVNPRQDCKKPGDHDGIGGKKEHEFQQDYYGDGDYSRQSKSSINLDTNNEGNHRLINIILYLYLIGRGNILINH